MLFDAANFYLPVKQIDPFGQVAEVEYDTYALAPKRSFTTINGVTLETAAEYDYRTLQARLLTDPNGNHSTAITDAMGMVVATAIFGKTTAEGDSLDGYVRQAVSESTDERAGIYANPRAYLQNASSFFYYDLHTYRRTGTPNCALGILREIHASEENGTPSPLQISFAYSDGFGRAIAVKEQAEPGDALTVDSQGNVITVPTDPRWVGNGRTVFNNKGKPVKQYEPYFSNTWEYESETALVEYGVTPVLHYDPAGRVVQTDLPDGTFTKVEFTPWEQRTFDQNDTVLESVWFKQRTDSGRVDYINDPREQQAAMKAQAHADTPGMAHLDTLGRVFLTEENNGTNGIYQTRVELDIEGNQLSVTDALGRKVMATTFNLAGETVQTISMDAGKRWMLTNAVGNPIYSWDERQHVFQYFFDALQRPTHSKVLGGDGAPALDHIFDRVVYGETQANAQSKNLLGQVFRHYDTGGLLEMPEYDFKGQPVSTTRQLFKKYKETANWIDANLEADLEPDLFTFSTQTDAIGRISRQVAPDGSIITPAYNKSGLLSGETVQHLDPANTTAYIKNIRYDEKGQRNRIIYGNDVMTWFYYDPLTFRLRRLESIRQNGDPLQDWHYTYDPVGNITHIEDKNAPQVFFDNQKITADSDYTYDALYRLINATGREGSSAQATNNSDNWNDAPFLHALNPGDPMALWNYTQSYQYDAVGNIQQMQHQANGHSWTRTYQYQTANNRLIGTKIGTNTYTYPHHAQHGFMTAMPHLEDMGWNFKEELVKTIRQHRTDGGTPETTYYQYDDQGQRIRKITENTANPGSTPTPKEERIYISGYELYKKHGGSNAGLERRSLSLLEENHRFVMIETRNYINDGTEKQLVRYQLHNHLGSAALELDAAAEVISYEEYHPFGTTAYQARNATIRSTAKRYRYTGMERDEETGLEYHSARYYLPWLGRWCSSDPIGIGDGVNLYAYCKSNPAFATDKEGTQTKDEDKPKSENRDTTEGINYNLGDLSFSKSLWRLRKDPELSIEGKSNYSINGAKLSGRISGITTLEFTTDQDEDSKDVKFSTTGLGFMNFTNIKGLKVFAKFDMILIGPGLSEFSLSDPDLMKSQINQVVDSTLGRAELKNRIRFNGYRIGGLNIVAAKFEGESILIPFKIDADLGGGKNKIFSMHSNAVFSTTSLDVVGNFNVDALGGILKARGSVFFNPDDGIASTGNFNITAPPFSVAKGNFSYTNQPGFKLNKLDNFGVQVGIGGGIGIGYSGFRSIKDGSTSFGIGISPLLENGDAAGISNLSKISSMFIGARLGFRF